jgi:hypothetical protein
MMASGSSINVWMSFESPGAVRRKRRYIMATDPTKTRGAGQVQVFDAELEPAAEQERLNRELTPKVPDSVVAQRVAHILDDVIFVDPFLEQGHKILLDHGLPVSSAKPVQPPVRRRVPTRGPLSAAQQLLWGEVLVPEEVVEGACAGILAGATYVELCKWMLKFMKFWRPEGKDRERLKILTKLVLDKLEQKGLDADEEETIKKGAVKELLASGLPADQAVAASKDILKLLRTRIAEKEQVGSQEAIAKIQHLAHSVQGWNVTDKDYGCSVELEPRVYVVCHQDRQGKQLLELISICGRADKANFEKLLRGSDKLHVGAITLRSVEDRDYLVLRHVISLDQATLPSLQRLVAALAENAGHMRQELAMKE